MAFCDAFHPDVAELHVADVVVVAAVDGEQSCSFVVEDVAVVDAYMAESLAVGIAVVAMRADVHGVCHVGPEDAAAHVNVLRSAPEPPSVVVERDAVVARAQEAILDLHPAAAHQVDAVGPRFGGKTLDVADGDVLALTTEHRIMGWIQHGDAIHQHILGIGDFHASQRMVEDAAPDNPHVL